MDISLTKKTRPTSLYGQVFYRFIRNSTGRLGGLLFIACILTGLLAKQISPYNPLEMHQGFELNPPNSTFLLGTDEFGRDLFSRVIYGLRMSLVVSFWAVIVGGIPGILSGLYTGYYKGNFSSVIMRIWDGLLAFPPMLLAIMLASLLGPGPLNAAIALGIISVPEFSRIVRSAVLTENEKDYVLASVSMGVSPAHIIFKNILPNVLSPTLVQAALAMGAAVALEAALSFIGLGIQPPNPSLGSMLNQSRKYLYQTWWYAVWPGMAITTLLLSLNWFAEALMEALDPRSEPR
jgi:ABC-type dipeptide/oligopeptide/nickel transport system permease subunit